MARRAMANLDPKEARQAIGRHFRRLTNHAGVNMAEFRAQLHEEAMVEMLAGFAYDLSLPAGLRRQCAIDVLTIGRGAIKPWFHDGQTINPDAIGVTGNPVREEIDAARVAAEVYQELDGLVARRVSPAEWPDEIRRAAGDAIVYFEETEAE